LRLSHGTIDHPPDKNDLNNCVGGFPVGVGSTTTPLSQVPDVLLFSPHAFVSTVEIMMNAKIAKIDFVDCVLVTLIPLCFNVTCDTISNVS